jgi:hypothetical protein
MPVLPKKGWVVINLVVTRSVNGTEIHPVFVKAPRQIHISQFADDAIDSKIAELVIKVGLPQNSELPLKEIAGLIFQNITPPTGCDAYVIGCWKGQLCPPYHSSLEAQGVLALVIRRPDGKALLYGTWKEFVVYTKSVHRSQATAA